MATILVIPEFEDEIEFCEDLEEVIACFLDDIFDEDEEVEEDCECGCCFECFDEFEADEPDDEVLVIYEFYSIS
jgi:hypothetical protein